MSSEQILILKKGKKIKKEVIETPSKTPKEEIKKEVIETPKEVEEIVTDELENARTEYQKLFGRKANPNTKLETLKSKIAEANA